MNEILNAAELRSLLFISGNPHIVRRVGADRDEGVWIEIFSHVNVQTNLPTL